MGNNVSGASHIAGALDSYVSELGADIIYEKSIGSSRFLKTVRARHRNGPVVIKLFIKHDPNFPLRPYLRRLKSEREALGDVPNVYNYQSFLETDRAGYIIRQWVANNLYDRISTRPFLSTIEKKWIAFQLVNSMKNVRQKKISHGDIRSENILITSWNWVYLTDFASFKPVYLPEDDPADYSYFFDTSGRRTCYIAPERFYAGTDSKAAHDGPVSEAMDVFSLGCVIAELFLDGQDTFTLSRLFKYRSGELDIDSYLGAIEDGNIRTLVSQMLAIKPDARPSFSDILESNRDVAFPDSFYSFLHNYFTSINETSSPSPFTRAAQPKSNPTNLQQTHSSAGPDSWSSVPSDSDHRIERIWTEFDSVEPILADLRVEDTITELPARLIVEEQPQRPIQDILPVEVHIPNRSTLWRGTLGSGQNAAAEDGVAVIILSLVCANVRNCSLPSSKAKALDLLLALAPLLTDESKLDRLVPYVVELLHDDSALVRASAIRTLTQVVRMVSVITATNTSFFPEYILPNLRYLTRDPEPMVRAMMAQCVVPLAETSVRFLEMSQVIKIHGTVPAREAQELDAIFEEESYDNRLRDLQLETQEQIVELLVDPSSIVKRAILQNTASLCVFFGRQKTNDVLLSHMITYLNDRDWLLREAFFTSIVSVANHVGSRSLEEYILPLMIQALSDVEETVVAKVLESLTNLAELGLFQKLQIWELMSAATGFLYHPNIWIRQGAAAFITSSAKHIPVTDVWCILYPSLRPLLRSDIREISEQGLLQALKPPLSRQTFDAAVGWAMRAKDSLFWDPNARRQKFSKFDLANDAIGHRKDKSTRSKIPRSEEDNTELGRLDQQGMRVGDETKILVLRDYILKLAEAIQSFNSRPPLEIAGADLTKQGKSVGLQALGIVPQTVFLNGRDTLSTPGSRRSDQSSRPSTSDKRLSHLSSRRNSRAGSFDHGGAYGDLRRKLGQMDGSVISLNIPSSNDGRPSVKPTAPRISDVDPSGAMSPRFYISSPQPPSSVTGTEVSHGVQSPSNRPSSPSGESLVSNQLTNQISAMRPSKGGIHVGDRSAKAAPALGTVNAVSTAGVLEAAVRLRADLESEAPSGRQSPMSLPGTARKDSRLRPPFSPQPPTTYDGQEPAIANVLEHVYQDNFREGIHDFGPRISSGPPRRRAPGRPSYTPRDAGVSGRPVEPGIIANLTAHGSCINGISVSPDHVFFVSCSDDKTVKIWDTARLERNVTSKPRHIYTQHHSRVTCICMVEASHCFASAAEDGSLHVVRVHVSVSGSLPKYGKLQTIREHRLDHAGEFITSMHHFNNESASVLIYTTTLGSIVVLDLRTMRILQTMTSPISHGIVMSSCVDKGHTWLLTGTQSGMLTLWDLRFGLLMRSWRVGASIATHWAMLDTPIHQIVLHPTSVKRTRVAVAITAKLLDPSSSRAPQTIIEVWDISKAALVESFVVDQGAGPAGPSSDEFSADQLASVSEKAVTAADAIAAFVRAKRAGSRLATPSRSPSAGSLAAATDRDKDADNNTIRGRKRQKDYGDDSDADSGILHDPDYEPPLITAARGARDVRALIAGVNFGSTTSRAPVQSGDTYGESSRALADEKRAFMITGSANRMVTFWDLAGKIERSTLLSGLDGASERPTFSAEQDPATGISTYIASFPLEPGSRPPQRASLVASNQQQLHRPHQDCVTALALLDSPFRGCVVSGDRAGIIKVLRVLE